MPRPTRSKSLIACRASSAATAALAADWVIPSACAARVTCSSPATATKSGVVRGSRRNPSDRSVFQIGITEIIHWIDRTGNNNLCRTSPLIIFTASAGVCRNSHPAHPEFPASRSCAPGTTFCRASFSVPPSPGSRASCNTSRRFCSGGCGSRRRYWPSSSAPASAPSACRRRRSFPASISAPATSSKWPSSCSERR